MSNLCSLAFSWSRPGGPAVIRRFRNAAWLRERTQQSRGKFSGRVDDDLTAAEQQALQQLGWNELCEKKKFDRLSPADQAAVRHGLALQADEWDRLVDQQTASTREPPSSGGKNPTATAPPSSSALVSGGAAAEQDLRDDRSPASTRSARLQKLAWRATKTFGPALGQILKAQPRGSSGGAAANIFGRALDNLPTYLDVWEGKVSLDDRSSAVEDAPADSTAVPLLETVVYLDDSGSMAGRLPAAHAAFQRVSDLLLRSRTRARTRILTFGQEKKVLVPRSEDGWSRAVVEFAWDGRGGGTRMWKMYVV